MFYELPFEAYKPVQRQIKKLWWQVNSIRRKANLPEVAFEYLPLERRSVKVFENGYTKTPAQRIEVARRMPDSMRIYC